MQGIIFNALEEFVLENADMATWNAVIDKSQVASKGVYTSGVNYDDSEIVSLATQLCSELSIPLEDGLKLFGEFLFSFLMNNGPIELGQYDNAQTLLENLDGVVHRDVKRLHPDAYTPFFSYEPVDKETGKLTYFSRRKLCMVAEGLLKGAAKHYGQSVSLNHSKCMHQGADKCCWDIKFEQLNP